MYDLAIVYLHYFHEVSCDSNIIGYLYYIGIYMNVNVDKFLISFNQYKDKINYRQESGHCPKKRKEKVFRPWLGK